EAPQALPRSCRLEAVLAERAVELGAAHVEVGALRGADRRRELERPQEVGDGEPRLVVLAVEGPGLAGSVLELVDEAGGDPVVADVGALRPVPGAGGEGEGPLRGAPPAA